MRTVMLTFTFGLAIGMFMWWGYALATWVADVIKVVS